MTANFEFDVFLSHSSKDKPFVRALAERLRDDGFKVWFDEWEIEFGDSIFSKVEYGLQHSHKLVLCMSANAFGSDWATLEHQTVRFVDPLNKGRRFIPVRLDDTEPKGTLAQLKYIDWRDQSTAAFERTYQQLRKACAPASGAARSTAPDVAGTSLPPGLAGQPDFSLFAQHWPHAKADKTLQLAFINLKDEAISNALCGADQKQCDDCILRVNNEQSGQLALFYQNSDGSFMQLLPHTGASNGPLAAGQHQFPGDLLTLPCAELGPRAERIHFTAPGKEAALAFLLPTLPGIIPARAPLAELNANQMRDILLALRNLPDVAMAMATMDITPA